MTDVAVTEALGESLSPSQVNTYMTGAPVHVSCAIQQIVRLSDECTRLSFKRHCVVR